MDNLRVHKNPDAIKLIHDAGARVLFLAPYSPDTNPIEFAWSKLKAILRRIGARTKEALFGAIQSAIEEISDDDAVGWFLHVLNPSDAQLSLL